MRLQLPSVCFIVPRIPPPMAPSIRVQELCLPFLSGILCDFGAYRANPSEPLPFVSMLLLSPVQIVGDPVVHHIPTLTERVRLVSSGSTHVYDSFWCCSTPSRHDTKQNTSCQSLSNPAGKGEAAWEVRSRQECRSYAAASAAGWELTLAKTVRAGDTLLPYGVPHPVCAPTEALRP